MKKEFLIAVFITFVALLLANLPYIYFSLFHPQGLHFLGRNVNNGQNTYVYASFIEQSRQGIYSFTNLFTTERQPLISAPTYVIIGIGAAILHLTAIDAYNFSRIFLSFLLCITLYWFLGFFFTKKQQIGALLLLAFAGGFGYFFADNPVTQLSQVSLFGLFSDSPALLLSLLLLLSGLGCYLLYAQKTKRLFLALCVLFCVTLWFINFSLGLLMIGILIALQVTVRRNVATCIIFSFVFLACFLFQILFLHSTVIQLDIQKIQFSPSPVIYFACYGLLIPLALFGLPYFLSEKAQSVRIIAYWIWINLFLLYLPFFNQQQVIVSLFVPIGIAAMQGFVYLSQKLHKKLFIIIIVLSFILLPIANIIYLTQSFSIIGKDTIQSYYYYISDNEYTALVWLKENTNMSDVILSNWFFGNLIPGIAGRRVYVGHQIQTQDFNGKITQINNFLLNADNKSAYTFLMQNHIRYIFLGVNDSMLQYGFNPQSKPYLTQVYNNGAEIYKVVSLRSY